MVPFTLLLLLAASWTLSAVNATELFNATFRTSTEGFIYANNTFGFPTKNGYTSGRYTTTRTGGLVVRLGGIDNHYVENMSGGWIRDFTLPTSANVTIDVRLEMNVSGAYEFDEFSQALCSIDGIFFGKTGATYLEEIYGSGTGGSNGMGLPPIVIPWKWLKVSVGFLAAGRHRLILGAYNNRKSFFNEETRVIFSDVSFQYFPISVPTKAPIQKVPVLVPINVPITAPTVKAPALVPIKVPVMTPVLRPMKAPVSVPIKVPVTAPVIKAPVVVTPIQVPVKSPAKVTRAPVLPPSSTIPYAIRINAGSVTDYLDPSGNVWTADTKFHKNGQIFNNCPFAINGTDMDDLYCKERFFNMWLDPSAKFQYIVPLPKVTRYLVRLHFAETYYTGPKQRIFDVLVGGTKVFQGLDIYSRIGFATALRTQVSIETTVVNASLTIEFVGKVENPKISGIEVLEITPSLVTVPTLAPVVRPVEILINCGGNSFDELYTERTWGADQYFLGGSPYNDGSSGILNTVDDQLYQTERYGEFQYEIPVPTTGPYTIILHFAELYWTKVGQRLFNIQIEKDIHVLNYDILARSNNNRYQAVTATWSNVTLADQFVSIAVTNANPQRDHPKLSGIEILGR